VHCFGCVRVTGRGGKYLLFLCPVIRFYLGKHSGRQLSLQPQLGSADLNAMFKGGVGGASKREDDEDGASAQPKAGSSRVRRHILQVSTYQMVVLMLFNTRDSCTYEVSGHGIAVLGLVDFRGVNGQHADFAIVACRT
jgi:hypothetical protein